MKNSMGSMMEPLERRTMLSGSVPMAPTALVQTSFNTSTISLGWTDNSSNETGFRVDRFNGHRWNSIARVRKDITAFTDRHLKSGRTYAYRVFAYNKAGNSPVAATIDNAITLQVGGIVQPTELAATIVSSAHTIVQFTDNSGSELGYNVQVSVDGGAWGFAGGVKGTSETGRRVFDFSGAQDGHSYSFRVAGYTAKRFSDYSSPFAATAAVTGVRPATLKNGKYYTFVTAAPSIDSTGVSALLMNSDGSRDNSVPAQNVASGYTDIATAIFGLPDGKILAMAFRMNVMGFHEEFLSLVVLGEEGVVHRVDIAQSQIHGEISDMFQATVGEDGRILIAAKTYGEIGLNSDIHTYAIQYNSDLTKASTPFANRLSLANSMTELPDGLAAFTFGNYVGFSSSDGYDPNGLKAPTSITVNQTASGEHLSIADVGTNETGLLITRVPFAVDPSDSVTKYDFSKQEILATVPSSGKAGAIEYDDNAPRIPQHYIYLAYPLNGAFIGPAVRTI